MHKYGLLLFCLFLFSDSANSFEVTPLIVQLEPQSGSRSAQVEIHNSSEKKIGATIAIYELDVVNGTPSVGSSAAQSFLVLPPAATVAPKKKQVVRMQWVGQEELLQDKTYVLMVEQVPVDANQDGVLALDVAFTFNVLLHVAARDSQPDLVFSGLTVDELVMPPVMSFELQNAGNGNAFGDSIEFYIDSEKQRLAIPRSSVSTAGEHFFIPPGGMQEVSIITDDTLRKQLEQGNSIKVVHQ